MQGCALEKFVAPLTRGDGVCHQNKCCGLGVRHSGRANDCFSGAAWQNNNARATVPESFGGELLILANLPALLH